VSEVEPRPFDRLKGLGWAKSNRGGRYFSNKTALPRPL